MRPTIWLVSLRRDVRARWARLLADLGARAVELEGLAHMAREGRRPGLVLLDWSLIETDPEPAVREALGRGAGARVLVFADERALLGPALAKVLGAGAADLIPVSAAGAALARRLEPFLKEWVHPAPRGTRDLRVDPGRRAVWVRRGRGPWVPAQGLTPKEFDLLCAFLEHPGTCLTRGALMERLWARRWGRVNPEVVDKHVGSLRRKLGPQGRRIETRRGRGYAFVAD